MDQEKIEEQDAKFADAIRHRLDEIWPEAAPHMVTNWMVGAAAISRDGTPILYDMTPMTCGPWEKLGMLQHSLMREQAKMTVHSFIDHQEHEGD